MGGTNGHFTPGEAKESALPTGCSGDFRDGF